MYLLETIDETQNGPSSEPAPCAAVPTYQKMKEVRIIMPYVKMKLATERMYVHREEDWKIEADEGYVTIATKRRRQK